LDETRVPFAKFIADLTGASDALRRHKTEAEAAAASIHKQIEIIRAQQVQLASGPRFGMAQDPLRGVAAEGRKLMQDIAAEEAEELTKSKDSSATKMKFAERRANQMSINKENYRFASNLRDAEMRGLDMNIQGSDLGIAGAKAELQGNSMAAMLASREQQRLQILGQQDVALTAADPEKRRRLESQFDRENTAYGLQTQMSVKSMAMGARPGISMGGMDAMAVGGINQTTQQNMSNTDRLLEQILSALTAPQHVNGN
jgi:hypothetical protein